MWHATQLVDSLTVRAGFTWHALQASRACRPVKGKRVTLWLNVAAVQLAVLWQDAHLAGDPKRPLWTVSAWQLAQVVPAARKLLSRWQLAQVDPDVRAGQREARFAHG